MSEQFPESDIRPPAPTDEPVLGDVVSGEQRLAERPPQNPEDSGSLTLTDADFDVDSPASTSGPETGNKPGPGLPEAFAWMIGVFLLQIIGSFVAGFVVAGLYLAETGSLQDLMKKETLKRLNNDNLGLIFAVSQGVSLIGIGLATWLRLGRERKRRLPLRPIAWKHLLAIVLAFVPLLVLAVQVSVVVNDAWDAVTKAIPSLRSLDEVSSSKTVEKMSEQLSFGMMILLVAVCPAVGEELVFRGVIGRGLIARWGLPVGIAITSVLFAAMHLHPPHVLVLLPLSVFLHISYQTTRSFYAPMLVHFLNNSVAVMVLSIALAIPEEEKQAAADPTFSPALAFGSAVFLILLLAFLWQTRVQYYRVDGSVWDPGYPTAEAPPEDVLAEPFCTETIDGREWAMLGSGLFIFLLCLILPVIL